MRHSAQVGSMLAAVWLTGHWVIAAQEESGRFRPLSLGTEVWVEAGDRSFAVYVPTRLGGRLTIATSEGQVGPISSPHGQAIANGQELGTSAQGWYTLQVNGTTRPYKISASLVQFGQSMRRPWNFYYWPTKADTIHEPWS